MKSSLKSFSAILIAFVASSGVAFAAPGAFNVPEPGSLVLAGLAIAGAIAVSRKGKK